jgi:hypothetical protein
VHAAGLQGIHIDQRGFTYNMYIDQTSLKSSRKKDEKMEVWRSECRA